MSLVLQGATRIIHFSIFIHEKKEKRKIKKDIGLLEQCVKKKSHGK